MIIVTVTEIGLYLCFCLLMGSLIFYSLPKEKRPDIAVKKKWLLLSTAGAGVLSLAPVLSVIFELTKSLGFWLSFKGVLFTFQIGKAWLFILVIALLLFGLIYFNQLERDVFLARMGVFLTVLLIGGYAKAGHAASLSPWLGFAAHFFHLLAVAIWGGCLFVAAWFSQGTQRWRVFLSWFTPLAIVSVVVVIIAGLGTMAIDIGKPLDASISATVNQYKQGLASDYGQALLVKHLLILPLICYAFFNGIYSRRLLLGANDSGFNPIKWARVESIVVLAIFIVTAFMGQQTPPHDLKQIILTEGASPLFSKVYQGTVTPDFILHFSLSPVSLLFIVISLLFIVMIGLSVVKRLSSWIALIMTAGFLASAYLCVMASIQ
ncbi:copper resistance D family protein [Camelliibacillus cellulosilyticus]|uniref:Copper resistance D family protein n=1 Tax=Camelliibacillus cellulosilyticus TaxID=2174486 RepID=A0ABV9GSK2_9BACL